MLKASVPTSQLTLGNAELAAYDTAGKTLWVADATGGKRIARTGAQGQLLKAWALPGNARAVAAGLDDSVWVLGNKLLWHYRADSTLLNDIDLQGLGGAEPKMLAVDSLGAWLWFDGERQLVRLDSQNPAAAPSRITLPGTADYTALDARTGELWIAVQSMLLAYDAGGRQTAVIDLAARGIKKLDGLVFDPVSRSPWILHDKSLRRVDAQAQRDQVFALGEPLSALGAAGFELVTQASIASPAQGALTNQALAPVSIQFDAACNGSPCGFAPAFFAEYRVAIEANGAPLAGSYTFDAMSGQGLFSPALRWAEGGNSFTARVTDLFGRATVLAPRSFVVDTVPPVLTVVSPTRSAWLNATPVRVAGSLNEAGSVVVNGQSANVQMDFTFTANLSLNEGANALVVEAQDLAGNRTRETLSVTLDTVPPSFAALAPADGTLTNKTRVQIVGTLSEEATLTVNGASATVLADKTFDHPVELAEGPNALVLVAVDRAGNRGTRTLNVIRDTVAPKLLSVSPAHGASVTTSAVRASGAFDDAVSVALTGPGVALSSTGANFAFDVTLAAGQNNFTLEATDGAGNVAQVPLNLKFNAVQYDPVDAPYLSVWDGMNNALKAGDTERALSYLTSGARERYAPIFNALIPHFTSIIATYSRPIRMIADEELGEYAIRRFMETDNDYEVFLIYFVKTGDGRWLIETM